MDNKQTVFLSKEKEVYRIPALFFDRDRSTFMAFAEQRTTTKDTSTKVLVMKTGTLKTEGRSSGRTIEWSELRLVKEAHLDGYRPMNPCPVYEKNSQTLFLFFICVKGTVSECWQRFWGCNKARLCYITTKDAGLSWSAVTDLTYLPDIKDWATFAVGPGHGVQTESDILIVPLYAYAPCNPFYCSTPYALYLYSDDKGNTWRFGSKLQTKSVECEMAEVSDDTGLRSIYCNARNEGGYRVEARDDNKGAGFITLSSSEKLVETGGGCQGSVVSFPAQSEGAQAGGDSRQNPNKWLLFTHPTDRSERINLGVYLNKTPRDPNAWSKPWIINPGLSGYSDLAYIDDGWFACLMECGDEKEFEQIACVVFNYKQVKHSNGE
uniref:sialidase-3-like n=1 Tax=Scatophagus argus TaxID=75038 RepID=UPI001ED84318|nr:sialidase-3-like [Scatophagus argus]